MIDMTPQESIALLQEARVGRVSMVTTEGRPYVIPVRFLWLNGTVYMRLAHFGRKADALERDPHVCFEADAFTPTFSNYASVLVEGAVIDVTDLTEKEEALFRFHEKYARLCGTGLPPRPVTTNGVALRKVIIEKLSGRRSEPDETPSAVPVQAVARRSPRPLRKPTRLRAR